MVHEGLGGKGVSDPPPPVQKPIEIIDDGPTVALASVYLKLR